MTARRRILIALAGAAGGASAIGLMGWLALRAHMPLMLIPFATSIVLVMGSPEAEPAQPRALIGGHLISTLVGLVALNLAGPDLPVAAGAVGVAMLAMHLTRTFHPPAGIDPLVVVINSMPWSFLLMPVAAGAVLLAVFAYIWHRTVTGLAHTTRDQRVWPRTWR